MKVSPVSNNKNNNVAFGYSFFLKSIHLPCAYCGGEMLSIPDLKQVAETLRLKTGDKAVKIIHGYYDRLPERQRLIVDKLEALLKRRPKEKIDVVIADLAKGYEKSTNNKYENAVSNAFMVSGIKQRSKLGRKVTRIIEDSREHLFEKTNNSNQKTLEITYLQNKVQNLINVICEDKDKVKLKKFITAINADFEEIKADPNTFFAKFGNEPIQSILGSLLHPIRSTVDHILPYAKNGLCENGNYLAVCGNCNWARAERPFNEWLTDKRAINLKKQFALLDDRLSPQFPKVNRTPFDLQDNIFKYLLGVQETIKEQRGEALKMDLPFFKERAAKLFGLQQ